MLWRIVVATKLSTGRPPRSGSTSECHGDGRDLEYHKRLRVAEPSRLAAALRTLFPNLRSELGPEEQERIRMNAAKRRRYLGCRWPWGPARDTEAEAETDALRLFKALDACGVHPRGAATKTALPRETFLIVAVVVVLVAFMVARLVQHSAPQASRLIVPRGPICLMDTL